MDQAVVGANNERNDADRDSGTVNKLKNLLENVKIFIELSKSVGEVRLHSSFDDLYISCSLTFR
jgi:hypothetical protein